MRADTYQGAELSSTVGRIGFWWGWNGFYTSIKSFSFLCWTMRIVGQKVSIKSLMAALSDCLPSSSCLLLHEYWSFVPNNNNIPVKETKIWLSFKTWCSLSVPQCTASNKRNWNSWCLYWGRYGPTWQNGPTKGQISSREHFGAETDLLIVQCTVITPSLVYK